MNLGEVAAAELARALVAALPFDRIDAVIAPTFPCLRAVLDVTAGTALAVGAQNMHWEARGAFTGEVSPVVLFELGLRSVIIGHSERRALFGETDAAVALKAAAARRSGLTPIVCVGENDRERDAGRAHDVVVAQIRAAFAAGALASPHDIVIAYEPVWAIGTGRTPQPTDVTTAHGAIRDALKSRFGSSGEAVRVLYGGSVTPANAAALLRAPGVDGALVGGASLTADSFASIAAAAAAC